MKALLGYKLGFQQNLNFITRLSANFMIILQQFLNHIISNRAERHHNMFGCTVVRDVSPDSLHKYYCEFNDFCG